MNYPNTLRHGAKGGVAGYCHQLLMDLHLNQQIDCGLLHGAETLVEGKSAAEPLAIAFLLDTIRVLVASHVPIDDGEHMPYLLAAGFKGPILCSEPSGKLLPIVLEDASKLSFGRDQKQIGRYIKLIEKCIIALPCKTLFALHDTQSRVRHDLKPFFDSEALQPVVHGNRSSGHRHRRERNVRQRSNRQLPEIHAARTAALRSVRRLPSRRHERLAAPARQSGVGFVEMDS